MPHPTPARIPGLPRQLTANPVPGGYSIKRFEFIDAEVFVILFGQSARVCLKYDEDPYATWQVVYCYNGQNRLMRAVVAANAWTDPKGAPAGYDKKWVDVR